MNGNPQLYFTFQEPGLYTPTGWSPDLRIAFSIHKCVSHPSAGLWGHSMTHCTAIKVYGYFNAKSLLRQRFGKNNTDNRKYSDTHNRFFKVNLLQEPDCSLQMLLPLSHCSSGTEQIKSVPERAGSTHPAWERVVTNSRHHWRRGFSEDLHHYNSLFPNTSRANTSKILPSLWQVNMHGASADFLG